MASPSRLTKSDFALARICPTKLYYRQQGYASNTAENDYLQLLAEGGYQVEALARALYPAGEAIETLDPELAFALTQQALAANATGTLFQATFLTPTYLARADILRYAPTGFELIEVKSRSYDSAKGPAQFRNKRGALVPEWLPTLEDVAFQVMVLRALYPNQPITAWLLMPDKAQRAAIDQLPAQFKVERRGAQRRYTFTGEAAQVRQQSCLAVVEVTTEVNELLPAVQSAAQMFAASLQPALRKIEMPLSMACKTCEYRTTEGANNGFRECWGALANQGPFVFDLYYAGSTPAVKDLLTQRRVALAELTEADLRKKDGTLGERGQRQWIQLQHTRANTEWRSPDLAAVLAAPPYPLHFIDFETAAPALPLHAGLAPYETVAFQWSCHTMAAPNGPLAHAEWLNAEPTFPNFRFVETLRAALGDVGTVLMWSDHERDTLQTIAAQLKAQRPTEATLIAWVEALAARLVDMNQIAVQHYFHPRMGGRTSIKVVLDAVWQTNPRLRALAPAEYVKHDETGAALSPYAALPAEMIGDQVFHVAEGTGALVAYHEMLYGLGRADPAAQAQIRQLLLRYCQLDTLAMALIWAHWAA